MDSRGREERKIMEIDKATKKKFAANVVKDASGCWNWVGSKARGCYGKFTMAGKDVRAHGWLRAWSMVR